MVKNPPAMWETWVQSLGWEDPLEKGMATHFTILAWKIPQTEKPGRLQSKGSQRVRYDWQLSLSLHKDLQSITNLCLPQQYILFFHLSSLSSVFVLSPMWSIFSHILPDNYGRNKIITQQKTWQYVCRVDLRKSIRQKIKIKIINPKQVFLFNIRPKKLSGVAEYCPLTVQNIDCMPRKHQNIRWNAIEINNFCYKHMKTYQTVISLNIS